MTILAGCTTAPIPPGKIVSNNPCVDAILAEIAAPGQVGAVSAWSHDATSGSAPLRWARRFPAIGSSAEEVIAARPQLALIGSFGNVEPLRKAGVPHQAFGVPTSVAESVMQVRAIASAIGRVDAGEALVARIEAALTPPSVASRLPPPHQDGRELVRTSLPPILMGGTTAQRAGGASRAPTALIYLSGGFVPGRGTLQDELLARAGYRNASAAYGLKQWEILPLETLVRRPPDVIFTPGSDDDRALALRHRVLARLRPAPKLIAFPDKLLNCGGPTIVDAMRVLRQPLAPPLQGRGRGGDATAASPYNIPTPYHSPEGEGL